MSFYSKFDIRVTPSVFHSGWLLMCGSLADTQPGTAAYWRTKMFSKTSDELKALLKLNALPVTGRKEDLVERIVDAVLNECITKCPTCNSAWLRYDPTARMYFCPGGFNVGLRRKEPCPYEAKTAIRYPWKWL